MRIRRRKVKWEAQRNQTKKLGMIVWEGRSCICSFVLNISEVAKKLMIIYNYFNGCLYEGILPRLILISAFESLRIIQYNS
jgi:hypothetical protein